MPNWAFYFSIYQWSKKQYSSYVSTEKNEHDIIVNLLASITAGAVANTVVAPMWTIRTRLMTQSNYDDYRNAFHAARKIYRTEGLHALYRGLIPSMLGLVRDSCNSRDIVICNSPPGSCWHSISTV